MRGRSIEVVIEADGSLRIDAIGFKGKACEEATAFLEQALGQEEIRKRKPEYLARGISRQRQELQQ